VSTAETVALVKKAVDEEESASGPLPFPALTPADEPTESAPPDGDGDADGVAVIRVVAAAVVDVVGGGDGEDVAMAVLVDDPL
jgi:hypothetical protein